MPTLAEAEQWLTDCAQSDSYATLYGHAQSFDQLVDYIVHNPSASELSNAYSALLEKFSLKGFEGKTLGQIHQTVSQGLAAAEHCLSNLETAETLDDFLKMKTDYNQLLITLNHQYIEADQARYQQIQGRYDRLLEKFNIQEHKNQYHKMVTLKLDAEAKQLTQLCKKIGTDISNQDTMSLNADLQKLEQMLSSQKYHDTQGMRDAMTQVYKQLETINADPVLRDSVPDKLKCINADVEQYTTVVDTIKGMQADPVQSSSILCSVLEQKAVKLYEKVLENEQREEQELEDKRQDALQRLQGVVDSFKDDATHPTELTGKSPSQKSTHEPSDPTRLDTSMQRSRPKRSNVRPPTKEGRHRRQDSAEPDTSVQDALKDKMKKIGGQTDGAAHQAVKKGQSGLSGGGLAALLEKDKRTSQGEIRDSYRQHTGGNDDEEHTETQTHQQGKKF